MKAIVKTKSNYKNANFQSLEIIEFLGTIICCLVPENGFTEDGKPSGKFIKCDFSIKEILSIR